MSWRFGMLLCEKLFRSQVSCHANVPTHDVGRRRKEAYLSSKMSSRRDGVRVGADSCVGNQEDVDCCLTEQTGKAGWFSNHSNSSNFKALQLFFFSHEADHLKVGEDANLAKSRRERFFCAQQQSPPGYQV